MTSTKKAKLPRNKDILTFEDIQRLTELVFIPSGYTVQLKNSKNIIQWEDDRITSIRGCHEGKLCYKVNFGRDTPCSYCTGLESMENLKSYMKEDRSFIDGKWYRIIGLPIIYDEEIAAIELIQEISADKREKQVFESFRTKNSHIFNIIRHDIPSYLHNVNLAVETLENTLDLDEDNQQFVKIAKSNITKIKTILDELHELSSLEDPIIKNIPINFLSELRNTIDDVIRTFPEKEIEITVDNKLPDENVAILANNLVSDIFLNILTNAIKHNSKSQIKVAISLTQEIDIQEYIKIEFTDNGNGIPPEIKEILFDRGERIKRGWKTSKGSSGLGLTIIKSLVDLFGAEIHYLNRVKDDWTKGTVVSLRFIQVKMDPIK